MNSDREKIAARLKQARTVAGLSQDQAAIKLGLNRPTITEIEAGRRKVTAEEIIQFADLYKVDSSWLLLQEESDNALRKIAARELKNMSDEDVKKLLEIIRILPKK